MTEKDIRPIPQYLLRKIGREDKSSSPRRTISSAFTRI